MFDWKHGTRPRAIGGGEKKSSSAGLAVAAGIAVVGGIVELGRGCEQVVTHGKLVVVTTKDPKRRVVGIDADSGAVRYTAGF